MLVHDLHLDQQTDDDIIWKHANDGSYSAATAYKAQFLGMLGLHESIAVGLLGYLVAKT